MPRLFTGIEIPSDIAAELAFLKGGVPGARWIEPEAFHITLRFAGDVSDETAHALDETLAKIEHPPIRVVA